MIPNNNLSVLPWYDSIEQQNARKWWIYGKVYPLFTPAGFVLPFQLIRPHRIKYVKINIIQSEDYDSGYIKRDGSWVSSPRSCGVSEYIVGGYSDVYFENIPQPYSDGVSAVALDEENNVLGVFEPVSGQYSGGWHLPTGTYRLLVQTFNRDISDINGDLYEATAELSPVESIKIYKDNGDLVGEFGQNDFGISVVPFARLGYDVIVCPATIRIFDTMDNGRYYAELSDSEQTWYSEIFTVVNDMSGYLKLEWWDNENFVMDAGTIVYKSPEFKNVLYLCSDIAKPEYDFDDQVIVRGGYTFPVQQISKKRYRFSFFASEYLLDVMRFVRMADYAQVTKHGQTYTLDTFLITPDWEDNGDVAAVDAEFTTATVAKKNGVGYIKVQRGNFNDDFNNQNN